MKTIIIIVFDLRYHQVRSYNYNIAVNIWLKGGDAIFDISSCSNTNQQRQTLDQMTFSLVEPNYDRDEDDDEDSDEDNNGATMFR